MNNYKKRNKDVRKLIPHSSYYCYDTKICPYMKLRTFSKAEAKKIMDKSHIDSLPVGKVKRNKVTLEYCKYIKAYLSVQDYVKDCDINTLKKYALGMKNASKDKDFIKRTNKIQEEFDQISSPIDKKW